MIIDRNSFNLPLMPLPIEVRGEKFHLSARFLEIDTEFQAVTNVDLTIKDACLVEYFEGLLLVEIQERGAPKTVGFAIYAKYFGSDDLVDDTVILTDIVTNLHHNEFTAILHQTAQRLSGIAPLIPDDLDVIRDVMLVTN